jgi:hypothetical protein
MCSSVLDDFNQNSPRLGRDWLGAQSTSFYQVKNNALEVRLGGPVLWRDNAFGATQEACITLANSGNNNYTGLLLKVQKQEWKHGAIKVFYDDSREEVGIRTYTPKHHWGWLPLGNWHTKATFPIVLQDGDQLAGQALLDGTVRIFVNGELIGEANAGSFFANKDGRLGMWAVSYGRSRTILDDFAGE